MVWAITHFRAHLYGNNVKVVMDHSAVKSILETPNPTGKHARWWTNVFGSGVRSVSIVYCVGRENAVADALSRSPHDSPPTVGIAEGDTQVASIDTIVADIGSLLHAEPVTGDSFNFSAEQRKDPDLKAIIEFLEEDKLSEDPVRARKLVAHEPQFSIVNRVLHFIDHRHDHQRRVAVPSHLRERLLLEIHGGTHGGHFSSRKLYNTLLKHWWWKGMYADVLSF